MNAFEIIGGCLMILVSVIIVIAVLCQEHKMSLGTISGAESSYMSTGGGRTKDQLLKKITKGCGILFFIITLVVYALTVYF